jgi:hypothetical protein
MLMEAAPAWTALAVLGLAALAGGGRDPGLAGPERDGEAGRSLPSRAVVWLAVLAVVGAGSLLPARVASYAWPPDQLAVSRLPSTTRSGPLLVFVHGGWANRVASTLAARGMRRDSVETALRRNSLCRVHEFAQARLAGNGTEMPLLDLIPLPGTPSHLRPSVLSPGETVRLDPAEPLTPSCLREMASDRLGVVELAPLLWQTALPGDQGAMLLVRDLGPERNARTAAAYPGRTPVLLASLRPGAPPELVDYDLGMRMLWGVADPSSR